MFFTLSKNKDERLPNHDKFGSWWFSHDDGWFNNGTEWFKGYSFTLVEYGSYLNFILDGNTVRVEHDLYRACPLWWDKSTLTLTNLLGTGEQVWADDHIKLVGDNLVSEKVDVYGAISLDTLTMEQVVDAICLNLRQKTWALESFNDLPKKLFITGGVDTLTLLSVIKSSNLACELVDYEHFEYDYFTNNNLSAIQSRHWAYRQMHHWRTPTTLITGGCGDEFMMRGPYAIAIWAAWHDIDLEKLLPKSTGYHVGYFSKESNITTFKNYFYHRAQVKSMYPTKLDLTKQLLNCNVNDHQHWHLGNTITWTPFKDLELTKLMLRLEPDDLMQQIIDATVNKKIIEQLWDPGLELLSTTKNHNNRQNLHKLALL